MMDIMDLFVEMDIPNNRRRMQGQKPMRWKHIWNARNERIRREPMDVNSMYPNLSESFRKLGEAAALGCDIYEKIWNDFHVKEDCNV